MGTRGAGTTDRGTTTSVARRRLLALLDEAAQRRLTTVVAPAGYGKTTLLEAWAASRDEPFAWLALRQVHDRAGRLAGDLATALRHLDGASSAILVLDDFQNVTEEDALDHCASVIEQLPETVHVVLASRADPPRRYFRLRLSDELAELRLGDLAFTPDEAAELLPAAEVDAAMERTVGWALGLDLADDPRVDDFLTAEVLASQPDDLRTFLLSTSVLDRLSGPLCDFVMSGTHSQRTLEGLERAGAFLTDVDGRHEQFEYHPMFRSVLRNHLREQDPAAEGDLLRRAAEWHLQRDEIEEGVRYLIEAGADDEVVEAAFTYGSTLFERHRVAEVAEWLENAAPSAQQSPASLALLEAAALIFGDGTAGARALLDAVDGMDGVSLAERLVCDLLRAYVEVGEGVDVEAIAAADRVLAAVDGIDDRDLPNLFGLTCTRRDLAAGARVARGVAHVYDGDLSAAKRDLHAVGDDVHGIWRSTALGALSLAEAWSGNLRRGEELAARAFSLADSLGHDARSRTTARLTLAFVARSRGDFERAATLLEEIEASGGVNRRAAAVWVATERAHIALASDIPPAGLASLAGQLVSAHPSLPTGVLARRSAAEAHLRIASGDVEGAEELATLGVGQSSELAAVRVRLAVERGDTARARDLVDKWPDNPQPRAWRERQVWTAVLDHLDGNEVEACSRLAAVVAEAEAEADIGLFQSAGKHAMGPARALYRAAPSSFLRALVDQPFVVGQSQPAKGLAEQLTDREYMVLVHLPSRQSNAEIADRLGVSLNTVKTHLKHIYRKLDAVGRSDAVEAAERLHLL